MTEPTQHDQRIRRLVQEMIDAASPPTPWHELDAAELPAQSNGQRPGRRWMPAAAAAGIVVVAALLLPWWWTGTNDRTTSPGPNTIPTETDSTPATTSTSQSSPSTTLPATTTSASQTTTSASQTTALPVGPRDMLDAWSNPPDTPTALDAVPRLLPTETPQGVTDVIRSEYADAAAGASSYEQVWGAGNGTYLLRVITTLGDQPTTPIETRQPVDVAPWDDAYLVDSAPGVANLILRDPSGFVSIWASGLPPDDLVDIARTLGESAGNSAGWDVPGLPSDAVGLHQGWSTGVAQRQVRWESDAGLRADLTITRGAPDIVASTWVPEADISVVEIGTAPALLLHQPDRASIVWSPSPDVVVRLGLLGTPEELLTVAQSVREVDQQAWEAASTPDPTPPDGCNSLFC